MKFVYLATFVLSVILVNNTNNGVPAQSNNLVKELNESISLPLVVLPHVAYAALDDASFQDCWNQLLHRTGISANLMPEDLKNKMEHEILAGNLSAGSSNSINIFNNTMNNVPDFMKEQLSTCMNTGVLP